MTTVFATPAELKAAEEQHVGYSDWLEITQDRVQSQISSLLLFMTPMRGCPEGTPFGYAKLAKPGA
jgi:hypothetical protein